MRSLSRIIKNSNLVLAYPRVIDVQAALCEEIPEEEIQEAVVETIIEPEEDPIEKLKEESRTILAETEQIVIGLLEKARIEARTIINSAQEEADHIRAQIFEESKLVREEASTQGYADGLKRAQTEIEADRQLAMEQAKIIVDDAHRIKNEMISGAEKDMVRLVLAIAKKVIVADLSIQPEAIVNVVRQAIANLDDPDNVKVYVNQDDIDMVIDALNWEGLTEIGSKDIKVEIKGDRRISRGGCVLESAGGIVDAQLANRLQAVETVLLDVVNE